MPRREVFYAPATDWLHDEIALTGEEHRHLARVLHHHLGERIVVVDGGGHAAEVEIISIQRERTEVRIIKRMRRYGEPFTQITLAPAVPKGSRFDWIVEKATELGVAAISPILTERTEVEARAGKVARWRRLALAAMKQCCRSVWPEIHEPVPFAEICRATSAHDLSLLAHEGGSGVLHSLSSEVEPMRRVLLLIGPEEGLTDQEVAEARAAGCQLMSLGPRRLRADTASLVALAKILSALGQLS